MCHYSVNLFLFLGLIREITEESEEQSCSNNLAMWCQYLDHTNNWEANSSVLYLRDLKKFSSQYFFSDTPVHFKFHYLMYNRWARKALKCYEHGRVWCYFWRENNCFIDKFFVHSICKCFENDVKAFIVEAQPCRIPSELSN